jgi:hypothetical protein
MPSDRASGQSRGGARVAAGAVQRRAGEEPWEETMAVSEQQRWRWWPVRGVTVPAARADSGLGLLRARIGGREGRNPRYRRKRGDMAKRPPATKLEAGVEAPATAVLGLGPPTRGDATRANPPGATHRLMEESAWPPALLLRTLCKEAANPWRCSSQGGGVSGPWPASRAGRCLSPQPSQRRRHLAKGERILDLMTEVEGRLSSK